MRRTAKYGQGWIPLGNPGSKVEAQLQQLKSYLGDENRDPDSFGLEAWIRSGSATPAEWQGTCERWRSLGATHLTFYTSGQGVGTVDKQIDAMRRFAEVARA